LKGEGRGSEHRCMPRISSTGSCKALATGQERVHGSIPVRTTLAQYERLLSALLGPYAMYAVHAASENAWTLICPCRPTPGANLHAASRQIARARQPRAWSGVGAGAPRSGRCHRSSRTSARSSARPSRPAGSGSASPRVAALGYTPRSRRRSSALRHEAGAHERSSIRSSARVCLGSREYQIDERTYGSKTTFSFHTSIKERGLCVWRTARTTPYMPPLRSCGRLLLHAAAQRGRPARACAPWSGRRCPRRSAPAAPWPRRNRPASRARRGRGRRTRTRSAARPGRPPAPPRARAA